MCFSSPFLTECLPPVNRQGLKRCRNDSSQVIEGMMTEIDLNEGIVPLKPPSHALEATRSLHQSPDASRRPLENLEVREWHNEFSCPVAIQWQCHSITWRSQPVHPRRTQSEMNLKDMTFAKVPSIPHVAAAESDLPDNCMEGMMVSEINKCVSGGTSFFFGQYLQATSRLCMPRI